MSSTRKHQDKRRANRKTIGRARVAARRARGAKGSIWPERWKDKNHAPTLGTVRRWMLVSEAAGDIERTGEVERTGKPGRPAQLWRATAASGTKRKD